MSELGFLAFGFEDEVDPVEAVQKKAAAIENINRELNESGIIAFALNAESTPEVEQRLLMREVNAAIDEVVERYLPGDDDAKKRVVSSIFRQFATKESNILAGSRCVACGGEDCDGHEEGSREAQVVEDHHGGMHYGCNSLACDAAAGK